MNWDDRLLSEEDLKKFLISPSGDLLAEVRNANAFRLRVEALIRHQLATWPVLRDAIESFNQVEYESFNVKGSEVLTQFNPKRIASAGAKVDASTIRQRACFLCPENLPMEEKGIEFGESFIVLCNPFPVLRDHLVVSSRAHTPQTIAGNFGAFLDLTRELGAGWFTLYNGPRCGASAPDHLHFQACASTCASRGVPIFDDVKFFRARETATGVLLLTSDGYRLNFVAVQGDDRDSLIAWFDNAIRILAETTGATEEPMLNLVATYWDEQWTVFIFPRAKHRPDCYFAEGDEQLLVSPGAIDLAGVMVVPNPDHYARITKWDLERIYAEVSLDEERFMKWLALLNDREEWK